MQWSGRSVGWVFDVWSLPPHLRHAGVLHSLCANDPQFRHAKMCGRSSYLVMVQRWLKTQIGPNAMKLSLSSAVVKLNTIEEWDLALRYSGFPSQHGGLAWWSLL